MHCHNSDIKLLPWASESNLKHLGIAMLYAKENPNTKSFKTINVIDWALRKLSAPMLKARRRSAGDNMLAPFLEPDDDSAPSALNQTSFSRDYPKKPCAFHLVTAVQDLSVIPITTSTPAYKPVTVMAFGLLTCFSVWYVSRPAFRYLL